MPMFILIEYCDNYSKTSRRLYQYCRDESNSTITDSESFKFKAGITEGNRNAVNTKDVEIAVPLKYLTLKRKVGLT